MVNAGKVKAKVTHNEVNGGLMGLVERLKALEKQPIYVGVPQSTTLDRGGGSPKITNAELLYIHTHGARKIGIRKAMARMKKSNGIYSFAHQMHLWSRGSALYVIPPRPVLEPALKAHRKEIGKGFQRVYLAAARGDEASLEAAITWTGLKAQNVCRGWFRDPRNGWPKNAPRTIKAKGSERPLIDSGNLRNSIIYVVREE